MFSISLRNADHQRRFSISRTEESGWEVRREEDRRLIHHIRYRDWHRVERARAIFSLEVSKLTAAGWQVVSEES